MKQKDRSNKNFWKLIAPILSGAILLFSTSIKTANADVSLSGATTAVFNFIGYSFFGKIAYFVSYLIAYIGAVFIALETWLIGAMLGLNRDIFQTVIVQKGFGTTLSIANLGFVLGIIIMAIATILHNETYGYKKILWKLVIAAILINFSLVIMAPVFNLGNSFTQYFLNCIDPTVGCSNPSGSSFNTSDNDFAQSLAGAFNPQHGFILPSSTQLADPNSVSSSLGGSASQMFLPIFSVLFTALELIMICIVLAAFVVMLLIRYLYIAFLAILMPFAWLGWVFPSIKGWWSKWWENFIRWTFFAPIVIFFLWLALLTTQSMSSGQALASQQFATYTSNSNNIWAPIASFFTSFFTPIIQNILNIFVMLGLTIGGLIVADRMSINGAKAGVHAAQNVGKSVGGWVGKQSKKGVRSAVPKKMKEKLQSGGYSRIIPRRLQTYAGMGLGNLQKMGSSELVDKESAWAKEAAKNPEEAARLLAGSLSKEKHMALLKALSEAGKVDPTKIKTINKTPFPEYIADEKLFNAYGQGKLRDDIYKNTKGASVVAAEAAAAIKRDGSGATMVDKTGVLGDEFKGKVVSAAELMQRSFEKMVRTMDKNDVKKMSLNSMFDNETLKDQTEKDLRTALLRAVATTKPQLASSMLAKLTSAQLKNFDSLYSDAINKERDAVRADTTKSNDQKEAIINKLNETEKTLKKTLQKAALGETPKEEPEEGEHAPAGGDAGGGSGDKKH